MNPLTLLRLSLRVLARNKARGLLTVLGIVIGVAAVIAMVALGTGAQQNIAQQIASLGSNLIVLMPSSTNIGGVRGGGGSMTTLTVDDVEAVKRDVSLVADIAPTNRTNAQVVAGDANWSTSVTGTTPSYYRIRDWPPAAGSVHTELDEAARNKVCVIGQTVATQLFGTDDPVGQTIRIRRMPFRVLGVLSPKGQSPMGGDQDDIVLIPFQTFRQRISGSQKDNVQFTYASTAQSDDTPFAVEEIRAVIRQRHKLREDQDDDVAVRNLQDMANASREVADSMTLLLGSIAGVSLLVGGIGIMNTMLVSVTERTREIGIRMAVGAKAADILVQFLVEAVVLALIGGAIGVFLGWLAAKLLSDTTGWTTVFDPKAAALAVLVSAGVGVFFGFWPARRAAKLDPIEALRYE
ncbi:MAG: ABC transporter permease [Deltaproteobacteria bacterium]|nr:ABC transporter permease [Deltaproteobacteria bacterium]